MNRIKNKYLILALIILAFLVYANSLGNQMFWDDNDFILNNQYVQNFEFGKFVSGNVIEGAGLISNYWRPMLLTVFSIEWHLWHGHVFGWHLISTLFHIANAILLFYFLHKLFDKRWLAFLVSLIFLIHPLQTEAVTYVNSMGDSLSVFFMLAGLLAYLKFKEANEQKSDSYYYIGSLVCYGLALMSKETAFVMPGLLLLIEAISLFPIPAGNSSKLSGDLGIDPRLQDIALASGMDQRLNRVKEITKNLWPFFAVAAFYLLLRATTLNFKNTFNLYDQANIFTTSMLVRILTFFKTILIYLGLLFYPHNLHMERSIDVQTHLTLANALGGLLTIGSITFAFLKFKKYPIVSFGILWFFIALIPTSNILIPINGLLYEHWLYLPMVGFWLAVSATGDAVLGTPTARTPDSDPGEHWRGENRGRTRRVLEFVAGALLMLYLIFLAHTTIARNHQWRDPITFYNQTLQYAPTSYRVINNLGMAYADAGDNDKAIETYIRAINLDPSNPVAQHNLGNSYKALGKLDLAIKQFQKAIELDPKFIYSYNALAQIYLDQNNKDAAEKVLKQYYDQNP